MIEVARLTKLFGSVPAVREASFSIEAGEIAGLLGPNGAGKTTMIRVLACTLAPTSGEVAIAGHDVVRDSMRARSQLGYLPENVSLYPEMTVDRFLRFVADLKGISRDATRMRIGEAMELCGVASVASTLLGHLSRGFRQRVGLAQALLGSAQVLILDEPTVGLDPEQANEFRSVLMRMRGRRTVLLSSHVVADVEATCRRVLIMQRGRLCALGTPHELAAEFQAAAPVVVQIRGPLADVLERLGRIHGAQDVRLDGTVAEGIFSYVLIPSAGIDLRPLLFSLVAEQGWMLLEMRVAPLSLEEVFLRHVNHQDI